MWRQATRFLAVGTEMGIAVAIGILGGHYLDDKLGTEPILFWVGFSFGLGAAGKALFDAARRTRKDIEGPKDNG